MDPRCSCKYIYNRRKQKCLRRVRTSGGIGKYSIQTRAIAAVAAVQSVKLRWATSYELKSDPLYSRDQCVYSSIPPSK